MTVRETENSKAEEELFKIGKLVEVMDSATGISNPHTLRKTDVEISPYRSGIYKSKKGEILSVQFHNLTALNSSPKHNPRTKKSKLQSLSVPASYGSPSLSSSIIVNQNESIFMTKLNLKPKFEPPIPAAYY